jgi:hypothetical protein
MELRNKKRGARHSSQAIWTLREYQKIAHGHQTHERTKRKRSLEKQEGEGDYNYGKIIISHNVQKIKEL